MIAAAMAEQWGYADFLQQKVKIAVASGFEVDVAEMNPLLKPVTLASVQWLLLGARRALFSRFGMHKTVTQLEAMRLIGLKKPGAAAPGTGPDGETCGSCKHCHRAWNGRYRKCELVRKLWTGGPGTDIKARSPACSKWEKAT